MAMGFEKDGASGRFVDATAFHADKSVFNHVDPTDAVFSTEEVQDTHDAVGIQQGIVTLPTLWCHIREGDELLLKMNAKLYEEPDDESREISSLRKNATVLSLGEATDGYLRVYSEAGDEGWVKTFLLKPKLSGASTTNTYQAPVIPVGSYGNNVGSTAPGMPGRPDSMLPGGRKCPPGNVTCCQLFPLSC